MRIRYSVTLFAGLAALMPAAGAETGVMVDTGALEYENTRRTVPLLEEDSQLGYEASMKYKGGLKPLLFKLKRMEELYGKGLGTPSGRGLSSPL